MAVNELSAITACDDDTAKSLYEDEIEVSLVTACEDDIAYDADKAFATLLIVSESVVPSPLLNVAVASTTEDEI